MKSILIALLLIFTLSAHSNCFEKLIMDSPVVEKIIDFSDDDKDPFLLNIVGDEWDKMQCFSAISQMLEISGCSQEEITQVLTYKNANLSVLNEDGCTFNSDSGIYQVMVSWMAEPPIAVILFSRWD